MNKIINTWSLQKKAQIGMGPSWYNCLSKIFDRKIVITVKPVLRAHSKRPKIGFQALLSLNAGQKYCRMLQGEHSAILLTFIKLPFVIKIFVLSIFEWPLKTGFTVVSSRHNCLPVQLIFAYPSV